jgi:hypothetical protein
MIEKEYYRFEDLKHRFDMTDSDIKYLLEEQKVPLCFHVEKQLFVLGFFQSTNFTGHCNIYYKGLVQIPHDYVRDLCMSKEIIPKEYLLLQKQNIEYIDSNYDYELSMPNEYFKSWHPSREENLKHMAPEDLEAKLYPWYRTRPQWDLGMLFATGINVIAAYKGEKPDYGEEFVKEKLQIKEMGLYPNWLYFKLEDICIQHEYLESLGLIKSRGTIIEQSKAAPETVDLLNSAIQFKNQFEELLARILSENRHIKPKEVHKLLCVESRQEEDSRHFDIENILYPETEGVISWRDKYRSNAERSYALDSLRNVISFVKKKLAETGQLHN